MKKIKWFFGILVVIAAVFTSCVKEVASNNEITPDSKGGAVLPQATPKVLDALQSVCHYEEFDLLGGQTLPAGNVTIANDGEFLYISVHAKDGFQPINENVKIWLGNVNPTTIFNRRPVPGKMPYKFTVTEGLDFNVKFELAQLGLLPISCENPAAIYAIVHADVIVDDGISEIDPLTGLEIIDVETAYAADPGDPKVGNGNAWWYYLAYTPTCCNGQTDPPACKDETAWGGNTDDGTKPWWFSFDVSNGTPQPIYAGQKLVGGASVSYTGGVVTIVLGPKMTLANVDTEGKPVTEPVKIQGYSSLPAGRPSPGQFTTYKGTSLTVTVGDFKYLAIHLDVNVCW